MNRRVFVTGTSAATLALGSLRAQAVKPMERKGRLKQGVCRWCYSKIPIEEFAQECARLGLKCIDLMDQKEWPVAKKYGLLPTMINGGHSIENGLNRKENHSMFAERLRERINTAAREGIPTVIVFSGNRKGMSDEEGLENCAVGLKGMVKEAEDKKILICMELLNSKVNHKDYMCDHTAWGVELVKRVGSENFKLLYDIYHMQIMEGDVIRTMRDNAAHIGHIHTGGNPGRNEIDETQELYYPAIARAVADMKYTGYFVHEFIPKRDPFTSLAQAVELCDV